MRTRRTVLQAHSSPWRGMFGNRGHGESRQELRRAVGAIQASLHAHQLNERDVVLRLDGHSGTGAVLLDLLELPCVLRCNVYRRLDVPGVQARVHVPADQPFSFPERPLVRPLDDCASRPCGNRWARPPRGGNTSKGIEEAADWQRTPWPDLRAVCDEPATRCLDGC